MDHTIQFARWQHHAMGHGLWLASPSSVCNVSAGKIHCVQNLMYCVLFWDSVYIVGRKLSDHNNLDTEQNYWTIMFKNRWFLYTMFCTDRNCSQRSISGFSVSFSPRFSCILLNETLTGKTSTRTRTHCGGVWWAGHDCLSKLSNN